MTSYYEPKVLVFPTFAMRRMLQPLHPAYDLRWYRVRQRFVLKGALGTDLRRGSPTIDFARKQPLPAAFLICVASTDFAASQ